MAMFTQIGHINLVNYLAYLLCLFNYLPTYLAYTYICPTHGLYLPRIYISQAS